MRNNAVSGFLFILLIFARGHVAVFSLCNCHNREGIPCHFKSHADRLKPFYKNIFVRDFGAFYPWGYQKKKGGGGYIESFESLRTTPFSPLFLLFGFDFHSSILTGSVNYQKSMDLLMLSSSVDV
ncbi:hypothetical protein CDAR_609021 [Caerostris darwini]|uniref:Secreted protein n=1 Tax=Caerostris darwini TaxID=1538125 RepID=A0AAV4WIX9_9ARAC|nr:hypothetical protein CDAR_609021 [Caerostris darwini]